jgi:glycosyltransferase involved in cell wall biosynthesis
MRVLVIDEEIPFPLNNGKRIRTFNLLAPLATKYDITFVCRYHEGMDADFSHKMEKQGFSVIRIPHPIRKKSGAAFYTVLMANLFSRYPYSVTSHHSPLMIRHLKHLIKDNRFDLIHCEWTPYAFNLKPIFPFPSVVDAHNVEAMIWKRNRDQVSNPIKKAFFHLQYKKMKRFEKEAFPNFSRVIAVSATDQAMIRQWIPERRIDIIENGVDISYFSPQNIPEKPYSLVFTGSMDWRPNIDATVSFLKTTYPLILSKAPRTTLTIAGRNPLPEMISTARKYPSVTLTGTISDIRPPIQKAQVFIVPIRIGGGSRLKILEAFAMKKAVVSTSIGAEGIDITPGKNILIADTPAEFSAAVLKLFQDPGLRLRLGKAGRDLVESKYRWKNLSAKLESSWQAAVTNPNPYH